MNILVNTELTLVLLASTEAVEFRRIVVDIDDLNGEPLGGRQRIVALIEHINRELERLLGLVVERRDEVQIAVAVDLDLVSTRGPHRVDEVRVGRARLICVQGLHVVEGLAQPIILGQRDHRSRVDEDGRVVVEIDQINGHCLSRVYGLVRRVLGDHGQHDPVSDDRIVTVHVDAGELEERDLVVIDEQAERVEEDAGGDGVDAVLDLREFFSAVGVEGTKTCDKALIQASRIVVFVDGELVLVEYRQVIVQVIDADLDE